MKPGKYEYKQPGMQFYYLAGIPLLKNAIMGSIGKFVLTVNPREKMPSYFIGHPFNVDSVTSTLKWTYFNETVHAFLIMVSGAIGYFCLLRGYEGGFVLMSGLVLLNIGLVLLQRMNRIRVRRVIEALKKRNPAIESQNADGHEISG